MRSLIAETAERTIKRIQRFQAYPESVHEFVEPASEVYADVDLVLDKHAAISAIYKFE